MTGNITFSRSCVYEATYTIKDSNNDRTSESSMLIKENTYEDAEKHLFMAVENSHIKIIGHKLQIRTVWSMEKEGVPFSDLMPVMCIKANKFSRNGVKGEKYFIRRSSIYMDPDGTAYGELYEDNEGKELMAHVRLDRFMSI